MYIFILKVLVSAHALMLSDIFSSEFSELAELIWKVVLAKELVDKGWNT